MIGLFTPATLPQLSKAIGFHDACMQVEAYILPIQQRVSHHLHEKENL